MVRNMLDGYLTKRFFIQFLNWLSFILRKNGEQHIVISTHKNIIFKSNLINSSKKENIHLKEISIAKTYIDLFRLCIKTFAMAYKKMEK